MVEKLFKFKVLWDKNDRCIASGPNRTLRNVSVLHSLNQDESLHKKVKRLHSQNCLHMHADLHIVILLCVFFFYQRSNPVRVIGYYCFYIYLYCIVTISYFLALYIKNNTQTGEENTVCFGP